VARSGGRGTVAGARGYGGVDGGDVGAGIRRRLPGGGGGDPGR
jgi:hypothetical protein